MPWVPSTKIATASEQKRKSNIPSCPMSKSSNTEKVYKTPVSDRLTHQTWATSHHLRKYHTKRRKHRGMIALSCNSSLLKRTEAEESRTDQPELPKKNGGVGMREEHKWVCSTLNYFWRSTLNESKAIVPDLFLRVLIYLYIFTMSKVSHTVDIYW